MRNKTIALIKRFTPFQTENIRLIELIEGHYSVIESKKTDVLMLLKIQE